MYLYDIGYSYDYTPEDIGATYGHDQEYSVSQLRDIIRDICRDVLRAVSEDARHDMPSRHTARYLMDQPEFKSGLAKRGFHKVSPTTAYFGADDEII